ncbi:hypothetical protein Hanom_Chr17g01525311 [Helianthus anomalus]
MAMVGDVHPPPKHQPNPLTFQSEDGWGSPLPPLSLVCYSLGSVGNYYYYYWYY